MFGYARATRVDITWLAMCVTYTKDETAWKVGVKIPARISLTTGRRTLTVSPGFNGAPKKFLKKPRGKS